MAVYHVVPCNGALLADSVLVTHDSYEARVCADALQQKHGQHYNVVKIEIVWTTVTLAELMDEEEGA